MFHQFQAQHSPRRHHRDPRRDLRDDFRRQMLHDPRHAAENLPFLLRGLRGRGGQPIVRRGEIRPLILTLLGRKPMHGYEIIQLLEAQSGGRWRPSAGSVYPTLQQLADEGLVTSQEIDGRRTYTLTDAGRAAATEAPAPPSWGELDQEQDLDLRKLVPQLIQAATQVQQVGSTRARRETNRILADARRQIYRLLADDEDAALDENDTPPA